MEKTKGIAFKPLKLTCSSSNCESALHYFKPTKKMLQQGDAGKCRYCGAEVIDWGRIKKLDVNDIEYIIMSLKKEMFRLYMWQVEIDLHAINYAKRKGWNGLHEAVKKRVTKYIATPNPPYDGRQTKREGSGNPICYAQHATATCCRRCMNYWYGIPTDYKLSDDEIDFFSKLIMRYLKDRLIGVEDDGIKVPPIRI